MNDFSEILQKYWGYDTFRPLQREVIETVCSGKDALLLMPTGGGKSLTYQVPGLAMEGTCVVITPLIALMKDQTDALRKRGIRCVSIHSGMTPRQIDVALDNCVYGQYKFLYVSPERIDSEMFRARFQRMKVSLIAVDEAHCISQWGYDFRPSYLQICRLRKLAPDAPVLALTATAPPRVARDIIEYLQLRNAPVFRRSFARENLSYLVRRTENKPEHLLRVIAHVPGSGIVYVRTRERAEKLAAFLNENGVSADFYHAGLGYMTRNIKQDNWVKGITRVIVATNAFGMGIDKADVRFVIHYDLCDSPESYYQEAGRAGRDGRPAYAVLLLAGTDCMNARKRMIAAYPPIATIKKIYEAIFNHYQIETGGGKGTSREFNLFEFCSKNRMYAATVHTAVKFLQMNGYMTLTDEAEHPPRIMFIVSRDDLYRIRVERQELDYFIKVLLRTYTGIFSGTVPVNLSELSYISGYTLEKIMEHFKRLSQLHIIRYIPGNRCSLLIFEEERLPAENVRISPVSYEHRKKIAFERLGVMIRYAESDTECRSRMLQEYFGETEVPPCGKCDVCREGKENAGQENGLRHRILETVGDGEADLQQLVRALRGNTALILDEIRKLLASGRLIQQADGTLIRNQTG